MLIEAIQKIADAIDPILPVKFFAITKSGRIKWMNKRMFTYKDKIDFNKLKEEDTLIFGEQAWLHNKEVLYSNKESINYERKDNKDFITIRTPYSEKGFRGLLGFFIDITKLKQVEQAKKEFIVNMSHDLRTPFSGIYTISELLSQNIKNDSLKEYLGYLLNCSKQWVVTIDQIIQSIVNEKIARKQFNINDLLTEIENLYIATIKFRQLQFKVFCKENVIHSDYFVLKKILINLVSNAIKFTKTGEVKVSAQVRNHVLTLEVEDTGIGISKERLPTIFEQCTQSDVENQNLIGLGLFLTKQSVEKLGGEITVVSKVGQGSLFRVKIPLPKRKPCSDITFLNYFESI